jgi:hypothetical protein
MFDSNIIKNKFFYFLINYKIKVYILIEEFSRIKDFLNFSFSFFE